MYKPPIEHINSIKDISVEIGYYITGLENELSSLIKFILNKNTPTDNPFEREYKFHKIKNMAAALWQLFEEIT